MINPENCEVIIKIRIENNETHKANITFKQNGARLSGFRLKDGPNGLWLEPPKYRRGNYWPSLYFDENKLRFKSLQKLTVAKYKEKIEVADTDEVEDTQKELNLDDIVY